jgi:hypothetical protein
MSDDDNVLFLHFYDIITSRIYSFSREARTHVDENGSFCRGAFFISIERRELLHRGALGFPWIPQDKLNELITVRDLTDSLSEYDPQNEFLVYMSIGLSTSRQRKGENDAIYRICRCGYKLVPDENEKVCRMVPASSLNAFGKTPRMCGNVSCTNSDVTSDLKRCSVCRCVEYCSQKCQKLDWKARHKEICKNATVVVRRGKKTLDKQKDWSA